MNHQAFFGDGEKTFALTDEMVKELERLTELGIGALYLRCVNMQFQLNDLVQTIRLGLVGGGHDPEEATALVAAYAKNRQIGKLYPLALDILDARWGGDADE